MADLDALKELQIQICQSGMELTRKLSADNPNGMKLRQLWVELIDRAAMSLEWEADNRDNQAITFGDSLRVSAQRAIHRSQQKKQPPE